MANVWIHRAWHTLQLPLLFFIGTRFLLFILPILLPHNGQGDAINLRYPRNVQDIRELTHELSYYVEHHHSGVVAAFVLVYTFLQCFGVPGSMLFAVLSGALFPSPTLALALVTSATAIGASGCYLLSQRYLATPLAYLFPERLASWGEKVKSATSSGGSLLGYLLAARIAPTLPNWFINLSSPHLHIPLRIFFPATFFGVAPLAFVCVRAGKALREAGEAEEIHLWTLTNTLLMVAIALVTLLPMWVRKYYAPARPKTE